MFKFIHTRPSFDVGDYPELVEMSNLYGITIASAGVKVMDYHSDKEVVGWSMCLGDPFCRKTGRNRALSRLAYDAIRYGRAVSTVEVPRVDIERGNLNKAFWRAVAKRVGDPSLSFVSSFEDKAAALLVLSRETGN